MGARHNPNSAVLAMADQLRAIALEGLTFAKDPYDKARYERILEIAAVPVADALELNVEQLKTLFQKEIGCITPKLGADVAVINDLNQILILQRADNTGWCLPCGWVDVGEDPTAAAVREVREETGLFVEALGYIAISKKGPGRTQNIQHQVNALILTKLKCHPENIKLSHEHTDYRWIDSVADLNWHNGHDKQVECIVRFVSLGHQPLLPMG